MNAKPKPVDEGRAGRKANQRAARQAAQRRRRNRRITMVAGAGTAIALVIVVILAFFGGDDGPAEPSASVRIEGTEFAYSPNPVLALAGEVEINFENKGDTGHDFVLLREGVRISLPEEFNDSMSIGRIPSIASGTAVTRTVTLEPGTYQIVCLLPDHLVAGMQADLIVSRPVES